MHRAKTSRLPKFILSMIAVMSLIFGGSIALLTPASAAVTNGCISSGFKPQNCTSQKTPIADIVAVINTSASTSATVSGTCLTPSMVLNQVTPSGGGYTLTPVVGTVAGLAYTTTGATATLSGTTQSTAFATKEYIILATCADSSQEAFSFTVTVTTVATPIILPASQSIDATTNSVITPSVNMTATNFSGTVAYTISPTLPNGLSLSSTNGSIRGTPTVSQGATSYALVATYTTQTAGATIVITITDPAPTPPPAPVDPPVLDRKVTICHRTHSETNPYVRITVDYNSVNKKSGHQGHDEIFAGEHVFKAGIYKRAKDKDWGDIIPADPTGFKRWQPLNWTALGAQIYNGTVDGCPGYDPVKYYNALREAGVPEKKIKQEIADIDAEQQEAKPYLQKTNTAALKYSGSQAAVTEQENDKVTICHRTNSTTNPYRRITVSSSSITNKSGHYGHDEIYLTHHVFDSSVNYPNNKKDWGDIIPADPTGKARWQPLNWTALGQQIYDGTVAGCSEQTLEVIYNQLRESGLSKKEIVKDLEAQKDVDDDPKDIDEVEYTGTDPEVKKSEPKEPVDPSNVVIPDQSLSGIVWLDLNRDGLKDPDEPFMPKITLSVVQLTSITPSSVKKGSALATAGLTRNFKRAAVVTVLTDANGFYIFPSLGAGDWKVVTGVPSDLTVTYDSQGTNEGEIIATVPVASHAFTWVGLVSPDEKVNDKLLSEILTTNPSALPLAELPTWLQKEVVKVIAKQKAPETKGNLAETGSNLLINFLLGLALLAIAAISFRLSRRR